MNALDEAAKLEYFASIATKMLDEFRDTNKGKRVYVKGVTDQEFKFEGCFLSRDGTLMILYRDIKYHSSHECKVKYIERIGD